MLLAVLLLAFGNWILSPEEASRWLRAMLILPALWLMLTLWHWSALKSRRRRGIDDESAVMRYFGSAMSLLFVAVGLKLVVMLGLKMWVEIGGHHGDLDVERRIFGLASSAVFVIVGNALPKILTPLSMLPRELAQRVTTARRFVGTVFVILGLLTALAFLSAPLTFAGALLRWASVAGGLTILGAIVWMNLSGSRQNG